MDHYPKSYVDETKGLRPGPEQGSFNNVIYSTWYIFARKLKGQLTERDLEYYNAHIDLNNDQYGLYKPKNSHDNITYKAVGSLFLNDGKHKQMSFIQTVKSIGFYRIWDVITYAFMYSDKLVRLLLTPFLVIPALQMIEAVANEGKVRPDWIESGDKKHLGRLKWWFSGKRLTKLEILSNKIVKHWVLPNGEVRHSYHMQNDGKHLAIFKLYVLRDKSFIFDIAARICDSIFRKRYGEDYTYQVIKRYFDDQNHPLIKEWERIDGIL